MISCLKSLVFIHQISDEGQRSYGESYGDKWLKPPLPRKHFSQLYHSVLLLIDLYHYN